MNLKRHRPELPPEEAGLLIGLFGALEEGLECCARLTESREAGVPVDEIRPQALTMARTIAYASRVTWESILNLRLLEYLPEHLQPLGALNVLAQLAYGLTALAEDDPEPETLLSRAEIDGLIAKYGIERWFEFYSTAIGGEEGATS